MAETRKELHFKAIILRNGDMDAAYVEVPFNIKEMFGKGRLLVKATFDGAPYEGQVVKMGTPGYIIGIPKSVRQQIGKSFGDEVRVTMVERETKKPLWTCPHCGRIFRNGNQDHYCGMKPESIEDYINAQEVEKRRDLQLVREALKNALPEAEERISWSMPTYWKKHNIIHFAAFQKHIGVYPGPEAVEHFQPELQDYKTDKGTIRIPYGKVDASLLSRIAQWCLETDHHA